MSVKKLTITKKIIAATALTAFANVETAKAAVVSVADVIGVTNSYTVERLLSVTITNDPAVYMVGTVTIDPLNLGSSFNEAALATSAGRPTAFGNGFGNNNISIIRNGGAAADSGSDFAATIPVTFALKVDQVTGDQWLWVNPNFAALENLGAADVTVDAAFSAGGGQPVVGSALDRIVFRGGDFDTPKSVLDYTDFSVYYGGSSPFVPEPSTTLLGVLGACLMLRRRRA